MSEPSPYNNISISEGGRFVRYEWEANCLTDEQMETVRKHVEMLQAENSKLRNELDLCLKHVKKCEECEAMFNCAECEAMLDCDECLRADSSQKERKRVDYENAKLRELVRDMHKWLWNGADCTECPFAAKCDLNAAFESDLHAHICIGWSEINDRMRELGVEP